MKSIDNLREYALTAASVNATTRAVLAGYVDEIEREVEELRDRDYRNGREDAKGAVEFADRLKAAVDEREDVTLFGVDYTALPVDVDGVSWHVGDMTENGNVVIGMTIDSHGWHFTGTRNDIDPAIHRHYVPKPTVEDVLREMLDALDIDRCDDPDGTIAEYAAKLRLAGDE